MGMVFRRNAPNNSIYSTVTLVWDGREISCAIFGCIGLAMGVCHFKLLVMCGGGLLLGSESVHSVQAVRFGGMLFRFYFL